MNICCWTKQLKYYGYFKNNLHFYPRYFLTFVRRALRKPTLKSAELFIETRCNFSCWHCSSSDFITKTNVGMGLEELRAVLKKLKSVGVLAVSYVGGEPTVNENLEDMIRLTKSYKIVPTIITNAYLLTDEKIDSLFKAGLANMGFSLQSFSPEIHDKLVNRKNAFHKIISSINYCLKKGYTCSICVVPTNENLENGDFDRMIGFANECKIRINVNLPAPIGKLFEDNSAMLNTASLNLFKKKYFHLDNLLPDFKSFASPNEFYCPMGESSIYILPNGEVCPCTFTHVSFGNILTDDIHEIIKRLNESKVLSGLNRNQCPIAMDNDYIAIVNNALKNCDRRPPKWNEIGF
jgi:MoaA/NifB/PqqE/SkfB family radical SAM enzyme